MFVPFNALPSARLYEMGRESNLDQQPTRTMNWLKDTHQDSKGNASWARQASSLLLAVLAIGLLTGHVEWGSNFILALGIIFGTKAGQKHIEDRATTKAAP